MPRDLIERPAKDVPVIFSAPMVRALLDGRKTQTRRLLKPPACIVMSDDPTHWDVSNTKAGGIDFVYWPSDEAVIVRRPFPYMVGDRLWVRENWQAELRWEHTRPADIKAGSPIYFAFGDETVPSCAGKARPSIHMPRWASRLTLIVEAVKVERLQDISEEDARTEGIAPNPVQPGTWMDYPAGSSAAGWADPRRSFQSLWNSLHGADAWDANPFVVALTFRVIRANIDAPEVSHAV